MAMIISSLIVCVYYNVVMCYTLYFMGATFQVSTFAAFFFFHFYTCVGASH